MCPSYFSGREAVSVSRREQVRKGLHTVAYDDTEQHRMLGCFGPDGRNCCYYPSSGSIQMLTSECGGSLFDEVGRGGKGGGGREGEGRGRRGREGREERGSVGEEG